ncbi:hypothetical protein Val02_61600 [Virgisporangium aliadipatigenens]|uniref:Uncharacterized protein n=1 Tax=Virgisporangium aliadipatigenens TaxID=741659 RepID=A0A8J3YPF5_9ACTN|nr:hypothetical protein [Virgisporangium aliadipatigenens]GIJ49274.1 hypothetical protein Val02_61600 [Virgisporangium aliadipatigenens]
MTTNEGDDAIRDLIRDACESDDSPPPTSAAASFADLVRQGESLTAARRADAASHDYELARTYRRQAEEFRAAWLAGRAREIAYVIQRACAGDPRFSRMSEHELQATGRMRWSKSGHARKLAGLEEEYSRLAKIHLEFAEQQGITNPQHDRIR